MTIDDGFFEGLGRLAKPGDPIGELLALEVRCGSVTHLLRCKCGGRAWLQQGKKYRCFDCEEVTVEPDACGGWREVTA